MELQYDLPAATAAAHHLNPEDRAFRPKRAAARIKELASSEEMEQFYYKLRKIMSNC